MKACLRGFEKVVEVLIDAKANVDIHDEVRHDG